MSDKSYDEAVDWLINSRYVELEAREHFWHICDGETVANCGICERNGD